MATSGKPLDNETRDRIKRLSRVASIRETAKRADVSRNTVRKILREGVAK